MSRPHASSLDCCRRDGARRQACAEITVRHCASRSQPPRRPRPRFHRHYPTSGCDRDCRCDRDAPVQPPDRARPGQWEDSNALCSHDVPTLLPSASLGRCPSLSPSLGNRETGLWVGWHAACTLSIRLRCCWQEGDPPPLRRNLDPSHPPPSFPLQPRGRRRERLCLGVSMVCGAERTEGGDSHAPAGSRTGCLFPATGCRYNL